MDLCSGRRPGTGTAAMIPSKASAGLTGPALDLPHRGFRRPVLAGRKANDAVETSGLQEQYCGPFVIHPPMVSVAQEHLHQLCLCPSWPGVPKERLLDQKVRVSRLKVALHESPQVGERQPQYASRPKNAKALGEESSHFVAAKVLHHVGAIHDIDGTIRERQATRSISRTDPGLTDLSSERNLIRVDETDRRQHPDERRSSGKPHRQRVVNVDPPSVSYTHLRAHE